jgi:hypothetical protein
MDNVQSVRAEYGAFEFQVKRLNRRARYWLKPVMGRYKCLRCMDARYLCDECGVADPCPHHASWSYPCPECNVEAACRPGYLAPALSAELKPH